MAIPFLLELLARRSQKRAGDYRNSGFTYFRELAYSDGGRGLEKRRDTWIESEIQRFHRGISLALLLLATVLLMAETLRYSQPHDRQALLLLLLAPGFAQFKLLPSLWVRSRI